MHDHGPGGVIAAIVTPVAEDGTPDAVRFLRHARWLLANGADGLNVLGTTGEATSFSAGQRRTLMTAIASELDPSRLMVGTGCPDLATTTALTRHAHDLGFGAALVLPPYYYKGVGDNGLYSYFASLVEATADRPIPILLYNFPQMTGIRFSPALAERLSTQFPGRIVGAKEQFRRSRLCRGTGKDRRFRRLPERRDRFGAGTGKRLCRLHLGDRQSVGAAGRQAVARSLGLRFARSRQIKPGRDFGGPADPGGQATRRQASRRHRLRPRLAAASTVVASGDRSADRASLSFVRPKRAEALNSTYHRPRETRQTPKLHMRQYILY
ncbi:dihydrodipicolinate synthase family protein [uncultured Roseibium sp.]|uniref:dihydrodipicolinate synthase family protein n=1 Tax=uncultured Roseibium sp. TaxID=1936171 RepID=UPI00321643B2